MGIRFIGQTKAKSPLDVSIRPYFRPFSVELEPARCSGQRTNLWKCSGTWLGATTDVCGGIIPDTQTGLGAEHVPNVRKIQELGPIRRIWKTSEAYFTEKFLTSTAEKLFVFLLFARNKRLGSTWRPLVPVNAPVNWDHVGSPRVEISHSLSKLNQADKDDDGL